MKDDLTILGQRREHGASGLRKICARKIFARMYINGYEDHHSPYNNQRMLGFKELLRKGKRSTTLDKIDDKRCESQLRILTIE